MAKKRHHSSHAKHHSSRHMYEGSYEGMDGRRKQEREDGAMIREDRKAVANLPQNVMYHEWPKARHYHDYGLDDTIRGIDRQENEDNAGMERHLQPGKY